MSTKRVLITGGAGFVGACLARRLLSEGHRVELLLRPQSDRWRLEDIVGDLSIREADLREKERVGAAVAAVAPDWIFHCAAHGAYSWQTDPGGIFESNVLGTLNLAEACVYQGFEAFVQAGSSSEYGLKDHPPTEKETPEPNSYYAVAKVAATLLCRNLAERHGVRMLTLRLYSVYGPWEDPRRLIPTLVAYGVRGELPPLVNPKTARDFVHVDDVCQAFMLAAQATRPEPDGIYNVGSGRQTTLREVVDVAKAVLRIEVDARWGSHEPRAWDTDVWVADSSKIQSELGWSAHQSLSSGIEQMAAWLRGRPDLIQRYNS